MISATRRLTFEAGHRVFGHESKCAHPHGHSYKVEVTAEMVDFRGGEVVDTRTGKVVGAVLPGGKEPSGVDSIGRVIDFSVLKAKIGTWIDEHWDHAFIYNIADTQMATSLLVVGPTTRVFALPYNPTAENLARYLIKIVCPSQLDGTGVRVTHVRVHETENCYADASSPRG